MSRNRNRYAALAAARRGDWAAMTKEDHLDLLDVDMLNMVISQALRHPDRSAERAHSVAVLREEIHRREIDAVHAEEMRR